MKAFIITILIVGVLSQSGKDTEITQVDFMSNFSLGKQDQLNKTFQFINQKLPALPDVTLVVNSSTYYITKIQTPHFFYVDSKQKATIEEQQITISGGYLQTEFRFSWQKKNTAGISVSGNATGFGFSDQVIFSKALIDDRQNKDLYFNLSDYQNISYDAGFRVIRVSPQTVTQDDMVTLRKMLNYIQDKKSVKDHLMEATNSIYAYSLKNFLHDEKFHFNGEFNYTYERRHDPSRQKFIVNMTSDLKDVALDRTGIRYDWKTNITGYNNWKYLNYSIGLPLNPKQYGGLQQMISFTVYQNLVRYAMDKGQLNSELNKMNWQSRFFQFFCGDLYEVIPKVAQTFFANEPVDGLCNAVPGGFSIKKNTQKTFNVTMEYDCSLNAQKKKINDFNVKLNMQIEGRPRTDRLNFEIVNFNHTATFSSYMDFKIVNEQLAQEMMKHSLNRLRQTDLFGNGWKTFSRDYPHFHVEHDYTLVYDSTHVDFDMLSDN